MAKPGSKPRRRWLTLTLGLILTLLVVSLIGGPLGPRDLIRLRSRRSQMEAHRAQLLVEQADLKSQIAKLQTDDTYIQHMIRRELGYTRPNELVYRFSPSK